MGQAKSSAQKSSKVGETRETEGFAWASLHSKPLGKEDTYGGCFLAPSLFLWLGATDWERLGWQVKGLLTPFKLIYFHSSSCKEGKFHCFPVLIVKSYWQVECIRKILNTLRELKDSLITPFWNVVRVSNASLCSSDLQTKSHYSTGFETQIDSDTNSCKR